jgi:hypothetical protein
MPFRALFLLATLGLAACGGDDELPESKPADPSVDFEIPPPNVNEDWPCPPFGTPTTEEDLGDEDGDLLANCQEAAIGTDPASADTDGDGFDDFAELGVGGLLAPEDTDGDDQIDSNDADDDDDRIPTADEGPEPDYDADGIPNHLDEDDDNDEIVSGYEDFDGDGVVFGDDLDDDADGDGLPNWLDSDDDDDCVNSQHEKHSGLDPRAADLDEDGIPDYVDPDDDGDGIISCDEDPDGDGDPSNDDLDADRAPDFRDLDEDGDLVSDEDLDEDGSVLDHDSDGDGTPDYRDGDDDNDGVTGEGEVDPAGKIDARIYDLDGDGRPNYRDANDDGDGCTTAEEDLDGDGDPTNDNTVVETGEYDPADYLDPAAEECADPQPEPSAAWGLTLHVTGLPASADGHDLLVTVSDGTTAVQGSHPVTGTAADVVITDALASGAYQIFLSVDLDDSGLCEAASAEETDGSWLVTGLSVTDYDIEATLDVASLLTDRAELAISDSPANRATACAANGS